MVEESEWNDLENIGKSCHFELLNQAVYQRLCDLYLRLATKVMLLVLLRRVKDFLANV